MARINEAVTVDAPAAPSESPAPTVRVRCNQTGFATDIPKPDWDAYTDDQRAAYTILNSEG